MFDFQINKFMCPLCGKETVPIIRKTSRQRQKGHRKWLYCPWCKKTVNTYECRNHQELQEFKHQYDSGVISQKYIQEMATLDPKDVHA